MLQKVHTFPLLVIWGILNFTIPTSHVHKGTWDGTIFLVIFTNRYMQVPTYVHT